MPFPDLTPPSPIAVIGADHAAHVEQWAARHRAELGRLRLTLRAATLRAERAERDAPSDGIAPRALLAVFDSMLDEAAEAADVALDAARGRASAMVAAEHERATDHLRSLGIDPLSALGPAEWTSETVPPRTPHASARELWQHVQAAAWETVPTLVESEPEPQSESEVDPVTAAQAPVPEVDRGVVDDLEMAIAFPSGRPDPARVSAASEVHTGHPLALAPADEADLFDDAALAGLFEDFWRDEENGHRVQPVASAGLGRPPPRPSDVSALPVAAGPDLDDLDPVRAFPSRWPDASQAAWAFHGPLDLRAGHTPMPRRADDAERFDDFWAGRESMDVFWDGAESRRPLRERLRRRTTQEQR